MFRRIVVPLDGSRAGEAIFPFVQQIARPADTDLILVRVEPEVSWEVLDLLPAFGEEERAARLEEARQYLSS